MQKRWRGSGGRRIARDESGCGGLGGGGGGEGSDTWGKEQMGDDGVRVKVWRRTSEESGER